MCPTFRSKKPALFVATLLLAGSVQAATVEECVGLVNDTYTTIDEATTFLNPKDETGLKGKASSAAGKLNRGKFADAATVLAAMRDQVASLVNAAKPKLGAVDGAAITFDIDTSSYCVTQLMTQP